MEYDPLYSGDYRLWRNSKLDIRMICYVSDFDLGGSGYSNIGVALCNELAGRGNEIMALGLGYKGQEHNLSFRIIPVSQPSHIVEMVGQLKASGIEIDLIVALDIPLQEKILNQLDAPSDEMPYIGIFPLEAGPLCGPWAISLARMHERLIMSEFGKVELAKKGIESEFIPFPPSGDWRPPAPGERQAIRQGLGVEDGQFVVLTVADNQERKNLSRSMEIFADFAQGRDTVYWMVTRPEFVIGWELADYADELGIFDKFIVWQKGIPQKKLWALYAAADAMLLTSKAEGLGMPILEAMACRLPVVGTKCAAIEEHLKDRRGLLIEPDYSVIDVWGNSERFFASRRDGVYRMRLLYSGMNEVDRAEMLNRAQEYVNGRTWSAAADVLEKAMGRVNGKT